MNLLDHQSPQVNLLSDQFDGIIAGLKISAIQTVALRDNRIDDPY